MIGSLGKRPGGKRLERLKRSSHYRDGKFRNLEPTDVNPGDVSIFKVLAHFLSRPASVRPSRPLPSEVTDLHSLDREEPVVVWFGHSSYFLQLGDFKVLVDPVFSGHASPVSFFGKAFKGTDRYVPEDFPYLDLLVLTHDHYDHLDHGSVQKLVQKAGQVICPLGVGAHLEKWNCAPKKIKELDWWEMHPIREGIDITATPSRHFSGRGLSRDNTLWSSYVLTVNGYRLFLGGDSGYDRSFRTIGKQFGPFDLAFLECGQYGKYWPQIHMFPEQCLQAGMDLGARVIFPIHWGKFALSTHPWNEPVKRFSAAAEKAQYPYAVPKIGRAVFPERELPRECWWDF